jgi:vacuolar-type H+-ATPase subunit H
MTKDGQATNKACILADARAKAKAAAKVICDEARAKAKVEAKLILDRAHAQAKVIIDGARTRARGQAGDICSKAKSRAALRVAAHVQKIKAAARSRAKEQAQASIQKAKYIATARATEKARAIRERAEARASDVIDRAKEKEESMLMKSQMHSKARQNGDVRKPRPKIYCTSEFRNFALASPQETLKYPSDFRLAPGLSPNAAA